MRRIMITALSLTLVVVATVAATAAWQSFEAARSLTASSTITINGTQGVVLSGIRVATSSGPCISITGAASVTIAQSQIGPCGTDNTSTDSTGIEITGNSAVNIYDNYIHVSNQAATCSYTHNGIYIFSNSATINIQGNVIAYNENNIFMYNVANVSVTGNFVLNPRGSISCSNPDNLPGHSIQAWADAATPNASMTVSGNYLLNSHDANQFIYPSNVSDSINFGITSGITANNNYVVGGDYISGCGLIADSSAINASFSGNIISNSFNCGIGIAGGNGHTASNNKVLVLTPASPAAVGIGINGATCPVTITGNIASAFQGPGPDNTAYNQAYYNSGSCATPTLTGNTFDSGDSGCAYTSGTLTGCAAYQLLHPMATTNPPPLIPPLPHSCVAKSPYSTQTTNPACP